MPIDSETSLVEARTLFGSDLVGPEEVGRIPDADPLVLARSRPGLLTSIPYPDAGAEESYDHVDFTQPSALVLGAEGQGLRRLVRESWIVWRPSRCAATWAV